MSSTKEAYIEWLNSSITDEEWARLERREAEIVYVEEHEPVNGDLQRLIDEAMDDMRFDGSIEDDHDWIRGGC